MKRQLNLLGLLLVSTFLAPLASQPIARAGYLTLYGGPTYDQTTGTGLRDGWVAYLPGSGLTNSGMAVGNAYKIVGGSFKDSRAVRWDSSGAGAMEMGILGTDGNGVTRACAYAVNAGDTAVGHALLFVDGSNKGDRAVRWSASGAVTELGNLGVDSNGSTIARAYAVNAGGTAVGIATLFLDGINKGYRAARWSDSGMVTELDGLGIGSNGRAFSRAGAVNDAGTAVGYANKYVGGSDKGLRAVRWNASGTAATELGELGTDIAGWTDAEAYAVNSAGTAVGEAILYVGGSNKGYRAVRWDASGTAATELGGLGTDGNGYTEAEARVVNTAGTAVGWAEKFVGGIDKGPRAVRWDASGTAATELGDLGTDNNGYAEAHAWAVSDAGTAVGWSEKYVNGNYVDYRAVLWGADGLAVDLNSLIDPGSGWKLTEAAAISKNGMWISGQGTYDPDGPGPLLGYTRLFMIQMFPWGDANRDGIVDMADYALWFNNYGSSGATNLQGDMTGDGLVDMADYAAWFNDYGSGGEISVPEPATLTLLAFGGLAVLRRRRRWKS